MRPLCFAICLALAGCSVQNTPAEPVKPATAAAVDQAPVPALTESERAMHYWLLRWFMFLTFPFLG